MSHKPSRVFVVDDSAVVRRVISETIESEPELELAGSASDPIFAERKMHRDWPDVVILDIEMPRMDGLTFLRRIMSTRPTPVVICSTLTERGTSASMEALSAGAVEVVAKPEINLRRLSEEGSSRLRQALRAAARAEVSGVGGCGPTEAVAAPNPVDAVTSRIICLGSSTGGTTALETVLTGLPPGGPPVVAVQHMPEKFTAAFAARLNQRSHYKVSEALAGSHLEPGKALLAPGGMHAQIARNGRGGYQIELSNAPPVNRHKPSVDVLFRSAARVAGAEAVGVIMTGMGADGAQGLLEMEKAGAITAAQDKTSSIVFGMPKEAIALGATQNVIALESISGFVLKAANRSARGTS